MNWTDKKETQLRKALNKVYPDVDELKRFVKEECHRSDLFQEIAEGISVVNWAFRLIEKLKSQGDLDDFYQLLRDKNPEHQAVIDLRNELEPEPTSLLPTNIDAESLALDRSIELNNQKEQQGHLLVAIKPSNRKIENIPTVNISAQLRTIKSSEPETSNLEYSFSFAPTNCTLKKIRGQQTVEEGLSELVHKAEETLATAGDDTAEAYQGGRIVIELFLPDDYLEKDVLDWQVEIEKEETRSLGTQRDIIIRSLKLSQKFNGNQINGNQRDKLAYRDFNRKWNLLKECVASPRQCDKFYRHTTHLNAGTLSLFLSDVPGLKLLTPLPKDKQVREKILQDITSAAIPIALWFSDCQLLPKDEDREREFNELLEIRPLTNLPSLAKAWQKKRFSSPLAAIKSFRLLCEWPVHWATFPNLDDPDDLLIS